MARNSYQSTNIQFPLANKTTSTPLITSSHSVRETNQQRNHMTHKEQCTITPDVYRQKRKPNSYDIQQPQPHGEVTGTCGQTNSSEMTPDKCAGACCLTILKKAN